jgi:hypothetical protein
VGQEVEHVGGDHLEWVLLDDLEEGLQVESDRPQRVGSGPPGHELQVAVDHRMAQRKAGLSGR